MTNIELQTYSAACDYFKRPTDKRFEVAKAVLAAIYSTNPVATPKECAEEAVKAADALLAELKR